MSTFSTFNITTLLVTAALFVLYWTLFRAHFRKQFKKPNDIIVHVPLPHLQKSFSKKTVFGEIRCRQFTFSAIPNEDTHNKNNSIWMIFISGHGDSLDIYDTLINQLYEKLISNPPKNGVTKINMIAYDRIGYGVSSSFNAVNGNNLCMNMTPTFSSITANDRAIELLSFLMNIEIDDCKFRLFQDELILIGHSYGGLIAQSFLNVLTHDLNIYYPHISHHKNDKIIKMLLMDSSWIDMDKIMGKCAVRKVDCYKDYFSTILGLQPPTMFYKYPSFNYLKQISSNVNYEKEIINNVQICAYYRAYGDQVISQWNESLGFWQSMDIFGDGIKDWTQKINNMKQMHDIDVKIYNLYSSSIANKSMQEMNKKWRIFQESLSNELDEKCLIYNQCIENCHHYIHLEKPHIVLNGIIELIYA